jgi:ribosome-binding factor A
MKGRGSFKPGARKGQPAAASQRQLRAGELVRHALVDILREEPVQDPVMDGVSVTITQARISPDLKHAIVFVEPLGGGDPEPVVDALNRHAKYLRGRLGRHIDMKFTPDLRFRHDESFNAAAYMDRLFDDPRIRQDVGRPLVSDDDGEDRGS